MVQVDIPIGFAIGSLLADAARTQLAAGVPAAYERAQLKNLTFHSVFVLWFPVYLLVNYFGFETSHMWWHRDSVTDYPWFLPAFVIVYLLTALLGFHVGALLVRRGRYAANRLIFAAGVLFFAGWVFLQPSRTLVVGTYQQWQSGQAIPVSQEPGLLWVLALGCVVVNAALFFFYTSLRKEGARSSRTPVAPVQVSARSAPAES